MFAQPRVDPYRFTSTDPCNALFPFPSTGLVAWYRMDETGGSADRVAAFGGVDLKPIATITDTAGIKTNGVLGAGSAGLGVTNSLFALPTSDFTISMWIKPTILQQNAQQVYIQYGQQNVANKLQYQIFYTAGGGPYTTSLYVHQAGGVSTHADYTFAAIAGVWHHLIATYKNNGASPGNLKIRANMGTVGTANTPANSTLNTPDVARLAIGTYIVNSGFDFRSGIDEVGIWNRVLTEDEQATLYFCGGGRTYP